MSWYVYMLRLRNDTLYVGHTNDLDRRFIEHSTARGSKATKDSKPVALIYSEQVPDHASAVRRELQIKRWSRPKKLALAMGDLDELKRLARRRGNA